MRVILLGANGMLGSMMNYVGSTASTYDVVPIRKGVFDALTSPISTIASYFTQPCCVVNCIGAIPQKKYTDEEMFRLNTAFPLELARLCHTNQVPLIHISTNCVFSGDAEFCVETDTPDAKDVYGQSKANGEPHTCVVLRCSIIGPELADTSFGLLEWFLHSQEGSTPLSGYADHFWNGLTTLELAKTIYALIDKQEFTPRIEHLYSSNTLSKYDLLVEAGLIFGKHVEVTPVSKGTKHYTLRSVSRGSQATLQAQLSDLSHTLDGYRAFHARQDVFLITSVVHTGSQAWSYTHTRSVFSPEERLAQTLQTIASIRALGDKSIILVSECSNLDASMEQVLKGAADLYVNCYDDVAIRNACIQSDKKGYGELLQTRKALQMLQDRRVPFQRFFKLSGRYWLTRDFHKARFSTTTYSFNAMLPNSTCHPTVLYSVPYSLSDHFKGVLDQCEAVYKQGPIGLETLLPPLCHPKTLLEGVGVAGYVAVDGTFYTCP